MAKSSRTLGQMSSKSNALAKVMTPAAGGPPFLKDEDGNPTQEAGYYLSVNRGKRSVELDLKSEEGRAAVRALAAQSDIVLENFKTGTLDRMGLGYADLKKVNPPANILFDYRLWPDRTDGRRCGL